MLPKILQYPFGDRVYTSSLYYGQPNIRTLRELPEKSVQCVITSPPYWNLRDYGTATWEGGDPECDHDINRTEGPKQTQGAQSGHASSKDKLARRTCVCGALRVDSQIGLEDTHDGYVASMVAVFREVHRVLRDDGTLWLNLGDSYASQGGRSEQGSTSQRLGRSNVNAQTKESSTKPPPGLKAKDLAGIPWRVALALQDDGWYLRSDIIWCLSGGSTVYALTQKGVISSNIKDLVRLDPSTVKLWNGEKWTQVRGWTRNDSLGSKLELVLRSGERIGCTDRHVWPTQRGNLKASDLQVGDIISTCILPEPDNAQAPGYFTGEVAWFLGLYLAEGSLSHNTIQLSLHADELPWVDRLRIMASHMGGTVGHTISGNKLSVRLWGRILVAVLETYLGGRTAHDKHLTNAAWRLPNIHLRALVEGYLDGDGHWDAANRRWRLGFTRNYGLERDLRTLAARLGAVMCLNPGFSVCEGKKFPSFKGEWRWEQSGHHNECDRGELVEVRRSRARQFWDIEVEDEPHLFALSSGVLTHNSKGNPMPESVTDRPTRSHEYIFLFTKKERYFYDCDAIMEPTKGIGLSWDERKALGEGPRRGFAQNGISDLGTGEFRNKRSVWQVNPKPYKGAHFATFPTALVEPCVRAGSSERGACATCGAPWARVVETSGGRDWRQDVMVNKGIAGAIHGDGGNKRGQSSSPLNNTKTRDHKGWEPTCECNDDRDPVPCVVMDPFSGSGTTGHVANRERRNYVGLDLNPDYLPLAEARILGHEAPSTEPDPVQDSAGSVFDLFGDPQ